MLIKMVKKLSILFVLLCLVAYFFGAFLVNQGIRVGIEAWGTQMAQTKISVDSVNVSLLSGKGTLHNLKVTNPSNFEQEHILTLDLVDLDIQTSSLLANTIIINKIYIQSPTINYEKNRAGTNLEVLQKNIKTSKNSNKSEEFERAGGDSPDARNVMVKKLIIENGIVNIEFLGTTAPISLPRIELNNISNRNYQESIQGIIDSVLIEVLQVIGPALSNPSGILEGGGQNLLNVIESTLLDSFDATAKETIRSASESLQFLFGK